MKARCKRIVLVLVLVGYLATGLIGPPLVGKACVTRANRLYAQALAGEEKQRNMLRELGEDPGKFRPSAEPDELSDWQNAPRTGPQTSQPAFLARK